MKRDYPLRRRISELEREHACRPNPDETEALKLFFELVKEADAGSVGALEMIEIFQANQGKKTTKATERKFQAAFDKAMAWRDERGYIPGETPMFPCAGSLDDDGNPKSCRQHPPCKDGCYAANVKLSPEVHNEI
jgi:hypothetical protein